MPQKSYNSRSIAGKLRVYRYLSARKTLKAYQPYTAQLDKKELDKCLKRYGLVYVKPNKGSHGNGIFQVRKADKNKFILRTPKDKKLAFQDVLSLYNYIKSKSKPGALLVIQQGIQLELVNGKPYDIRAMVQRKPGSAWKLTGIFAKVGRKNKIVTNYAQGGRIVLLKNLFPSLGLSLEKRRRRNRKLKNVSLAVAAALSASRSGMHEMGVDFAFDRKGKLWILEVNTRHPQFHPLKKLHPKMFKRMITFARSYGRTSAK